jgi:hypothetical protein
MVMGDAEIRVSDAFKSDMKCFLTSSPMMKLFLHTNKHNSLVIQIYGLIGTPKKHEVLQPFLNIWRLRQAS